MNTATILLAAGQASRMGKLKQLLALGEKTILGATLDNILAAETGEIIVVTGARNQATGKLIADKGVRVVHNPSFRQGMSTSLKTGVGAVNQDTDLILVALADQPLVRPETYKQLLGAASESDKGITLPVYAGQRGNPIVLHRRYFEEISHLEGDRGGRDLLRLHPDDILEIPVNDEGVITNINTPEDYERIKSIFD